MIVSKPPIRSSPMNKTALVVGGTSGIGEHIARFLASQKNNVIIAGRNATAAQTIIDSMKVSNPEGHFKFMPVDMSLMRDVKRFAAEVSADMPTDLSYLIITCGIFSQKGRTETPEGIDVKLALHYYGRHVLMRQLAPALVERSKAGNDVRVLSVLAAAQGKPVEKDDLDLKRKFSLMRAAHAACFYNDLMVEQMHSQYPSITWIHAYPGVVNTPLIHRNYPWLKWLMSFFATDPDVCAANMVNGLQKDEFKGRWVLMSNTGAEIPPTADQTEEWRKLVWQHSTELTDAAAAKQI